MVEDKIQNKSVEEYAMMYLENSKQIVEIEENLPEPWITLRVLDDFFLKRDIVSHNILLFSAIKVG